MESTRRHRIGSTPYSAVLARRDSPGIPDLYPTHEEGTHILSYQRDHYVDTSELTLPFLDDISGTVRGYRIFTACRTVRGKIFRLEDHLDRLYHSAAGIHMTPPMPRERLRSLLVEIVEENIKSGHTFPLLVDVIFSGGLEGGTMKKSATGAHLYVAVQKMEPPAPELYREGVGLATFTHQRMLPDVKLLNYVGAVIAHQIVVPRHDAYDVVFLCPSDGETILEGSTFTVFFVDAEGVIHTPPLDGKILNSVTRRVILELIGREPRFRLKERPVKLNMVPSFAEAFLVSTTRNVLPVVRIDATVIGNGKPGPVTRELMRAFDDYLDSY